MTTHRPIEQCYIHTNVYISNNKLVVKTNNGRIDSDGITSTKLSANEPFIISSKDLATLLTMFNGLKFKAKFVQFNNYDDYYLIPDGEIFKEIKIIKNRMEELEEQKSSLMQECEALKTELAKKNKSFFKRIFGL